jgi:hypothetical protein
MNEFLGSLKADLLDRRMLPIVVLLGVALAGALAYAALGGGGGASPSPLPTASPVSPLAPAGPTASIPVSAATLGADQPVAETTSGSAHRGGAARNPFAPLPGTAAPAAKNGSSAGTSGPAASPSSGSAASGPGSGSGTGPGSKAAPSTPTTGGETPKAGKVKSTPKKSGQRTVYRVAVLFGAVPGGSPAPALNLTPYDNLTRQQPLPSVAAPLVVFRGVIAGAKSASFTLVGEAILRGKAVCRPSTAQCQAIDLKLGETEELEYLPPEGAPVVYQLKLVSITASKASASAARRAFASESSSGLHVLRTGGLSGLPGLHYSSATGVLVRTGRWALAARAHALPWGAGLSG